MLVQHLHDVLDVSKTHSGPHRKAQQTSGLLDRAFHGAMRRHFPVLDTILGEVQGDKMCEALGLLGGHGRLDRFPVVY